MKHNKNHSRAGFTLTELLVVFAIMGILAAIAVPSVLRFIESGRQINRMSIARTIYLAAQNQLTELRITKNLCAELTSEYYEEPVVDGRYIEDTDKLKTIKNVYYAGLGSGNFPQAEIDNDNINYIHYIKKPKGEPITDDAKKLVKLLDPIILDKTILNDAILIEFNIKTGIVLSAFYGDIAQSDFDYSDGGDNSVKGKRGMSENGYEYAKERKQGYYGIGDTGVPELPMPAIINVYDSYSRLMPGDTLGCENALYAEIFIPQNQLTGTFDLFINEEEVLSDINLSLPTMEAALNTASTALVYRYDGDINPAGTPDGEKYARFIWVLDYVGGDMTDDRHSIGVKYESAVSSLDLSSNLRVGIKGNVSAVSLTEAHPYFFTRPVYGSTSYTVNSARHLYNIRYLNDGEFTQGADIELDYGTSHTISNFQPIPGLEGTYNGNGHAVKNLEISLPSMENVGLFSTITGTGRAASVVGLTLENPNIKGGENTGSVCGTLNGFITGIYVRYTVDSKGISGTKNVGGIVGVNASEGILTDSTFISPTAVTHVSGTDRNTIGGIVGDNDGGALKRVLFLGLAPENAAEINPIIGGGSVIDNVDNKNKLYYLSGTAKRPDEIPTGGGSTTDYNILDSNGTGEGLGTVEMYAFGLTGPDSELSADWQRKLKDGVPLTDDEALDEDNEIYPYPYSKHSASQLAAPAEWPIVEDARVKTGFTYYELYSDGKWGYSSMGTLEPPGSTKLVVNDGYAIEFSFYEEYTLEIGTGTFTITGTIIDSDAANPVWTVENAAGEELNWPAPIPFRSLENEEMFRLHIPNSVTEAYADGANQINLSIFRGTSGTEIDSRDFNPLFAPATNSTFVVRSPRHIDNIDKAPNGTYVQHLDVDFELYRKELLTTAYDKDSATKLEFTNQAVVAGEFTGNYNGSYNNSGKLIRNLTIDAPSSDNTGLFAHNRGTIRNVTLLNVSVTGQYKVGAIAGENSGTVTFCAVQTVNLLQSNVTLPYAGSDPVTVSGVSNVGGIVGINSGSLTDVYLVSNSGNAAVQGSGSNVGGIVGENTSTVTVSRILYLARFQSGSSVVVGTNSGSVAQDYYLSGELSSDYFSLNQTNFMSGDYNGTGGGKTLTIHNIDVSGWTGWTKAPNGGVAFTEDELLRIDTTRSAGYVYPRFTNAPQPERWPLVGAMSAASTAFKVVYYERYADTDYVGFWSSEYDDTLLYPNSTSLPDGLTSETLYVIEEGYVATLPIIGGGNSSSNMGIYTRENVRKISESDNNHFGSTGGSKDLDGMTYFVYGAAGSNPEVYMDGPNLVRFLIVANGATVVEGWFNNLYAKAIYPLNAPGDRSYPGDFDGTYSIRSPRQLENIRLAPNANFVQELNINMDTVHTNNDRYVTDRYKKFYYVNQNGNNQFTWRVDRLGFAGTNASVVLGDFTGSYDANYDRYTSKLYNLELIKNTTNANVSIFQNIASRGVVKNLILENNTIRNTDTGNVGGLAAQNAGTIENVVLSNCDISTTTGAAGGIAARNSGTIKNVFSINVYPTGAPPTGSSVSATAASGVCGGVAAVSSGTVHNAAFSSNYADNIPVWAATASNAGGIVQTNSGRISNVQYIANAPGQYPIASANTSVVPITDAYYLSGTHRAQGNEKPVNNFSATIGEPKTTQELNAAALWPDWRRDIPQASNTLSSTVYPYQYLSGIRPASWLAATMPAPGLAYYEVYDDASAGFFTDNVTGNTLTGDDSKAITKSGYCAIVPKSGGYSVKMNATGNNRHIEAAKYVGQSTIYYVDLPFVTPLETPVEIYVNDMRVTDANRFVNTLFAKGIYNSAAAPQSFLIRTPQQMQNISVLTGSINGNKSNREFKQERNLDFTGITLSGPAITGEFTGTFDGNGKTISNVSINAPLSDNIGLFGTNNGVIQNIVFNPVINIIGRGNTGSIAGHNRTNGTIANCIVGIAGGANVNIAGGNMTGGDGIAGFNEGRITGCEFNGQGVTQP